MELTDVSVVIALCYGTVGIVFWLVTQLRLSRVERRVSNRIVRAVDDIEKRVDKITTDFDVRITKLNETDETVNKRVDDAVEEIRHMILSDEPGSISTKIRSLVLEVQGEQARAMDAFLRSINAEDAIEGELQARIPSVRTAAFEQLVRTKMPKKYVKKYPMLAALWEQSKLELLRTVDTHLGGMEVENRGSAEFKPGV